MSGDLGGTDPVIDTTKASVARVYDAALGGKDNYAVDREMVERLLKRSPDAFRTAKLNKEFGRRVVRFLAEEGIDQFLDLGSGIPTTPPSVHDTVLAINPDASVVYVDSDPVVVAHSRALRDISPNLVTIFADITKPESILENPELTERIDFGRPVAVLNLSVMHTVTKDEDAYAVVRPFHERLAPGSYLALSHVSTRSTREAMDNAIRSARDTGYPDMVFRDDDSIRGFFAGFEIVEPGVVDIKDWRPEEEDVAGVSIALAGAVGKKTA